MRVRKIMECTAVRERLAALAEGHVGDEERALIDAHLQHCLSCQAHERQIEDLRCRLFRTARDIEHVDLEDRIMRRVHQERAAHAGVRPRMREVGGRFRMALSGRRLRLAGAGLVGVAAVALVVILSIPPPQAWALDETIEATKGYLGVYMTGAFDGHDNFEMWIRCNGDQTQMRNMLLRTPTTTVWVDGNTTSYYQRGSSVVYTDDAQTAGFSHWPGSRLFELVRAFGLGRVTYATDPATGHKRAIVEASKLDGSGASSLVMEFDTTTKLLVGLKVWNGLTRRGTPSFEAHKIVYFEDLPEEVFTTDLPRDVTFQPKEITVAPELIGLLSLPQYGVPAADLSEQAAVRLTARELWTAVMNEDLPKVRHLCPVTATWSDEMLRAIVGGLGENGRIAEVVDLGKPTLRGRSALGPLWVVPARTRHNDGHLYDEKVVILYRPETDPPSCVVHTGYGVGYRID